MATVLAVGVIILLSVGLAGLAALLRRRAAALDLALREQAELSDQLAERSLHDPLTGLAGRSLLAEAVTYLVTRSGADPHCLLLVNLDGFRAVNDAAGHPAGDEVLVAAARRLRRIAEHATVARLGGDEFAILLPAADEKLGMSVGEAVVAGLAEPHLVCGRSVQVTASVGLLPLTGPTSASDALRGADLAMRAAKAAGGDRLVCRGTTSRPAYA